MNIDDVVIAANGMLHGKKIKEMEDSYEQAFIATVNFRNNHTKPFNAHEKIKYSALEYQLDRVKTDLMQFVMLKNARTDILYMK